MALFEWSEKYSVHVEILDAQHRDLIDVMNRLHDAILQRFSKEIMGEIIIGLKRYVAIHFDTEEKLMQRFDYPGFDDHKRAHDEMRDYVARLDEKHNENATIVSVSVMEYMTKWLKQHILGVDKMYQDFFNSEGVH